MTVLVWHALAVCGCLAWAAANSGRNSGHPQKPIPGKWGGEHIRLEVTERGAEIELDCAHGSLDTAISPDRDGRFSVKGAFVREHPGPLRPGLTPRSQPAVYSGSIGGKSMTLRIELSESQETVGSYSLTYGEEGRVRKCR